VPHIGGKVSSIPAIAGMEIVNTIKNIINFFII